MKAILNWKESLVNVWSRGIMKRIFICLAVLLILSFVSLAYSETDFVKALDEINAEIEKTPDDPSSIYVKARILMELSRRNEGYETAKQLMALFIKKNDPIEHLHIETINLEDLSVIVGFNMGESERNPPETGIIMPLQFEVFKKDSNAAVLGKLQGIIDYQVGIIDGRPMSAAFRESGGKTLLNLNSMDNVGTYEDIRKIALDLIKKKYPLNPE